MTSIVTDLVHGYRDLMDNKSGKDLCEDFHEKWDVKSIRSFCQMKKKK